MQVKQVRKPSKKKKKKRLQKNERVVLQYARKLYIKMFFNYCDLERANTKILIFDILFLT